MEREIIDQNIPYLTREGGLGTFELRRDDIGFRGPNSIRFRYQLTRNPDLAELTGQPVLVVPEIPILSGFYGFLTVDTRRELTRLGIQGSGYVIDISEKQVVVRDGADLKFRFARLCTGFMDIEAPGARVHLYGRGKEAVIQRDDRRLRAAFEGTTTESDRFVINMPELKFWDSSLTWTPGKKEQPVDLPKVNAVQKKVEGQRDVVMHVAAVQSNSFLSVALSPDGRFLAGGGSQKHVNVWNSQTGELDKQLDLGSTTVRAVTFARNGNLLAAIGDNCEIQIWDGHTGERQRNIPRKEGSSRSIAFSPDGKLLAACFTESQKGIITSSFIFVWDVNTGEEVYGGVLESWGFQAVFSPDGRWLAATFNRHKDGKNNGSGVRFLSTRTWETSKTLWRERGGSYSVDFSSDGKLVANGGLFQHNANEPLKGEVVVWDFESGAVKTRLTRKENAGPIHASFSPDGKSIAGQHYGRAFSFPGETRVMSEITIWDVKTGAERWNVVMPFAPDAGPPLFQPDGSVLVTRDQDGVQSLDAATGKIVRVFVKTPR